MTDDQKKPYVEMSEKDIKERSDKKAAELAQQPQITAQANA